MPVGEFFGEARTLTLGEIALLTGATFPRGDAGRVFSGVATLETAGPHHVCFIETARFGALAAITLAGACFCRPELTEALGTATIPLITPAPQRAFALLAGSLYPAAMRPGAVLARGSIASSAIIAASAVVGHDVTIEPSAIIGRGAYVGHRTVVGPYSVIGPGVRVGEDCSVGPHCVVAFASLGDRVILHPGVNIGQDGFGFVSGRQGHVKVPQLGQVVIGDEVEIGAGTTIDRGSLRDTTIGDGTKIDNQVHIAHNVTIGRHCLIAGQVGIAGSAVIGDFVAIGGRTAVAPHIHVGTGAQIGGASAVYRDVPAGEKWAGSPAIPLWTWLRSRAMERRRRIVKKSTPEDTDGTGREGQRAD